MVRARTPHEDRLVDRITIPLTPEIRRKLDERAAKLGVQPTALVRRVLLDALDVPLREARS